MKQVYFFMEEIKKAKATTSAVYWGLLFLLLGSSLLAQAQAPDWQAAIAVSKAGGYSQVKATATDASGNVYIAGYFVGQMQVGGITLTSSRAFDTDGFVTKWSSINHSLVWAQQVGGTGEDNINALVINGSAIYLGGMSASASTSFGSLVLPNSNPAAPVAGMFVAKLVDAGSTATFTWVQGGNSRQASSVNALAISNSQVYLAGDFTGPLRIGSTLLTGEGDSEAFVAKLLDTGVSSTVVWAEHLGGPGFDEVSSLVVAGSDLYMAGDFEDIATFGQVGCSISSMGGTDVYVAKLHDSGTGVGCSWLQRAGGTSNDFGTALAVAGSAVYLAGEFISPTATFGSTTLANAKPFASDDIFVAKLLDAGSTASFSWAQRAGGTGSDEATVLLVQGADLYVAGIFNSQAFSYAANTLFNSGAPNTADVVVARMHDAGSTGSFIWAQTAGSIGDDYCSSLALSGPMLYVGGSVYLPAVFGRQSLTGASSIATAFWSVLPTGGALPAVERGAPVSLNVVPNPAHGTVLVTLPETPGMLPAMLNLSNVLGQTVYTQVIVPNVATSLNIVGVQPGLYLLRVQLAGTWLTQRLQID
jgi:hypothetical protein